MFLVFNFATDRETNLDQYRRIAYIDRAITREPVISDEGPNPDHYQPVVNPAVPDKPDAAAYDALEAYAQQQLMDGKLDAYFVLPDEYVLTGQVDLYTTKNVPVALRENIEDFLRNQIAAQAPTTVAVPASRLGNPAEMIVRDMETDSELTETALVGRILLPFIFVFLYFMATSTTAQFLMSGVVEEKENRLMEILATSLRPIELLWGKMLGLGGLALTQVLFWSIAGLLIALVNEDVHDFFSGASFRPADIALMIVLFLLNFLLFSAIMMGIGAAVTAESESRQIAGFLTFIAVLPLALAASFFSNPDGPLPLFFTFFPFTAAVGLIMRLGLTTIPVWQIALSLAIQVVTVIVVMWAAAKIFRMGMLMYGKMLTPRAFWRALREGRTTLTTASTEYGIQQQRKKRGLFAR